MTRNLKALGLALVAALAMGAVASAAPAAPARFTATVGANEQAQIHGEQNVAAVDTFKVGWLSMYCATAIETGHPEEGGVHKRGPESPSATFTPTYDNCHAIAFGITKPVTITLNGCTFTFSATKNTNSPAGMLTPFSADLTINCPIKPIEVHLYDSAAKHAANEPLCTYNIGGQTVINQIQLTNLTTPNPDHVIADINATVATHSKIFALLCGNTTNPIATYTGTHTLRATNESSQFVHSTVS